MNQFKAFLEAIGLDTAALVAGLSGGVATVYQSNRKLTLREVVGMLLVGMFAAGYLTPIVAKMWNMSPPLQNALSFIIGMIGMNVVGGMLKIGRRFENDPIKTANDIKNGKLSEDDESKTSDPTE